MRYRQNDGGACFLDGDTYLEGTRWVARCGENLAPVGTGSLLARVHNGPLFHKLLQAHSRSPTFPGVGVSAAPYLAGVRQTQKAATAAARRRRSTSRLDDELGSKRSTRMPWGGILLHYCVKGDRKERGKFKCKKCPGRSTAALKSCRPRRASVRAWFSAVWGSSLRRTGWSSLRLCPSKLWVPSRWARLSLQLRLDAQWCAASRKAEGGVRASVPSTQHWSRGKRTSCREEEVEKDLQKEYNILSSLWCD